MGIRAILFLTFFIGSLPVCFFRPFYGILLWTIVAFVNPQWYAWGASQDLPWALAVAVPTLLGLVIFVRGWERLATRECFLLLALWIWFSITSYVSANTPLFAPHAALTWYRWQFVSKILLMTAATVMIVNSLPRFRILLITIGCCFSVFVLKAVPFLIETGGSFRLYGPDNSMIADNNDFGLALNMTLPLYFFLAQTEPRPWLKKLFWLLFLSTIPAIFFTYSRGALVGLAAVLTLMFLQSRQRFFLIPAIAMGMTIAVFLAPAAWKERMDPTRPGALDGSARSRLNAWTYSWNIAKDYPLAGGGFDTYTPELFARYAPDGNDVHGPHSIYFGVLAEHGFVGLGLYLTLLGSCFLTTRSVVKSARLRGDRVAASYAMMLRFSLVGFMASGAFLGRAYFDYFFTIVALITILQYTLRLEWRQIDAEDAEPEERIYEIAEAHG